MQLKINVELWAGDEEKILELGTFLNFKDLEELQKVRREGIMIIPPYQVGGPVPPAVPVFLTDHLNKMLDTMEVRLTQVKSG